MEKKFSFKKGWNQLPHSKLKEVRAKIMTALNIVGCCTFYNRLKGQPEPKVSEARIIEEIFKEYGITDIWGE